MKSISEIIEEKFPNIYERAIFFPPGNLALDGERKPKIILFFSPWSATAMVSASALNEAVASLGSKECSIHIYETDELDPVMVRKLLGIKMNGNGEIVVVGEGSIIGRSEGKASSQQLRDLLVKIP